MVDRDEPPRWRKSTRSSSGNCIEVAEQGDEVWLRDSKSPAAAMLSFDRAAFAAFIEGVKAGEFDLA
jgi:hypothetical protein